MSDQPGAGAGAGRVRCNTAMHRQQNRGDLCMQRDIKATSKDRSGLRRGEKGGKNNATVGTRWRGGKGGTAKRGHGGFGIRVSDHGTL